MKLYLITYSNGRDPDVSSSLEGAKSTARRVSPAQYFSASPDGYWVGYATRSGIAADARGDAPHLIQAIVRPILDAQAFLADEDQPRAWLQAVRQVVYGE